MKAAIVTASGQPPILTDIPEPVASAGRVRVKVTASAVSQVTKSRASGHHYSAVGQFPFGVGIDGVGTLDDGQRVYFVLPRPLSARWLMWPSLPPINASRLPMISMT